MKKNMSRGTPSPADEGVPPSSEKALTSLARRDLFSGAFGATAVAAAACLAPASAEAAPATAKGTALTPDMQSADQADDLAAGLGVVRGTLAYSARENGTC